MIKALEIDCFADYKSIDILAVTLTVHFHPWNLIAPCFITDTSPYHKYFEFDS
jgi:hypothetical protein